MSLVILHVHSGNLYGGIETVMATLAREGASERAIHHFALCFDGRLADELREFRAPVHALGAARLSRPDSVRWARRALRRVVAQVNPDVILTHLPWTHAVFARALTAAHRPVVQWVHGPIGGVVGSLARLTLPDALICNSAHTRAGLPGAYREIPAATILNPVRRPPAFDEATRRATRSAMGTRADDIVVVQASRLEEGKGHTEHLRALARLSDAPSWVLWVIGGAQRARETAYLRELQDLARSLGILDRVRFAGEQQDVARFLASADLYCQPNTGPESFGLTYLEAMWAGLPVIASDICAVRDIVTPEVGRLVPPGDFVRLADVLCELIVNAGERERLSGAGPARAHELTDLARQVQRVTDFLEATAVRSAS